MTGAAGVLGCPPNSPGAPGEIQMQQKRVIKRYANRKLYDTSTSQYVTLDEIARLIRQGEDVQILDNDTKDDLTSVTLTQIILDGEKKDKGAMPLEVLRNLIQSRGETISDFIRDRVVNPVADMREEAGRSLEELRRRGEKTTTGLAQNVRDGFANVHRSIEDLTHLFDKSRQSGASEVEKEEQAKGFRKELAKLREQIDALEKKLKLPKPRSGKDKPPPKSELDGEAI
ncbi:MAG: hypothetical protein GMKNLPBB_03258 [Myxococcota bacterium]|nr:hypothetical protein [Myxococcota bacterium]